MKKRKNKKNVIWKIFKYLFYTLEILLTFLMLLLIPLKSWIVDNVGLVSMNEIIFHLKVPLTGTSTSLIKDVLISCFVPSFGILVLILLIFNCKYDIMISIKMFQKKISFKLISFIKKISLPLILVILALIYVDYDKIFSINDYIKSQFINSNFIEENYVDPRSVNIEFPNKKRNLIYIFLESMETTYMDEANGGIQINNLIPHLTQIANENTNFSNTTKLGGAYQLPISGWTIAAMVSQTAGIGLSLPINGNSYSGYGEFLPGVYSIGDILEENGYNQVVMMGSDSNFGGRKDYFTLHGNYEIKDLYTAREDGIISNNHSVFWGMEDSYLIKYAKEELIRLSKKEEPFNFTMLTVSTHFPDGYLEPDCENIYDDQYSNVINCSSKQIYDFLSWIKNQDFYDNTTIIIVGDHLTMASNKILECDNYDRTVFNVFINSAMEENNNINRKFLTLDLFPTTLASLGVKIEGNRLGLGTNLYSGEKTLIEEYSLPYVTSELNKRSLFYEKQILYKKD